MKNQFVPYSIALALKELGFDEECFGWFYLNKPSYIEYERCKLKDCSNVHIPSPLYQQVEQWFREKHHLFINIHGDGLNGTLKGFYYSITEHGWINWYESVDDDKWYDAYEEAREAAINKAIKIVKGEKNG